MKAKKACTLTPQELQELFDRPPGVHQKILHEYLAIKERIRFIEKLLRLFDQAPNVTAEMEREYHEILERARLDKLDLDAVRAEITDLLVTGAPVERGDLGARLLDGCLMVDLLPQE